jgi:hypothetical protein
MSSLHERIQQRIDKRRQEEKEVAVRQVIQEHERKLAKQQARDEEAARQQVYIQFAHKKYGTWTEHKPKQEFQRDFNFKDKHYYSEKTGENTEVVGFGPAPSKKVEKKEKE